MTGIKTHGMILLDGGPFIMGSDRYYPEERPAHAITVAPFRIDRFAVSNADFSQFVAAAGYVTTAEIRLKADDIPQVPPEALQAGSLVFRMTDRPVPLQDFRAWWHFVPGAHWRAPEGSGSNLDGRWDHPAVHISLDDAEAYAHWAGKTLPTEAQWEFAAHGGALTPYPWGNELCPDGKVLANTWHGQFPWRNDRASTPVFTCAVSDLGPTGFGTYNMIGNVWEWTSDKYARCHEARLPCCTPVSRSGASVDHVIKGGSFLCAPNYCRRYRAAARSPQERRSSTSHLGFRCVLPA